MTDIDPQLRDRYNDIHAWIMGGENHELQSWIDSGLAWKLEGHVGRTAMDALTAGACVAAPEPMTDYYGSQLPAYWMLRDEPGSPGSVANAEQYQDIEENG